MQHTKQLDFIIARMLKIRNELAQNPEIEFDITHLLPVVETSVNALAEEIDDEIKQAGG